MKLYLVRHGETEWNREGRMQGRRGVGLNETGVFQVEKLRDEIRKRGIEFDVCFASPLKRAVETAEILVGGKCEILYDERLVERGFGEFEGKSMEEFWASVGENDILDRKLNYSERGLEPIREVLRRAEEFLTDLKKNYGGEDQVLVVAHGALLRALNFAILGYTQETNFHGVHFENAEMKEYEIAIK